MLVNIIDRRTNTHLWRSVDAVIEATSHDNVRDSSSAHDNTETAGQSCIYRTGISVAEAVSIAQAPDDEVTLYLYDFGQFGDNIDYG